MVFLKYLFFSKKCDFYLNQPAEKSMEITQHVKSLYTVNSDIFARGLFSRNFAYTKYRENKIFAISRLLI